MESKSMDWFLYGRDLDHERVNFDQIQHVHMWRVGRFVIFCTNLKNVKNTHGGVLTLVKLQPAQIVQNWYQIMQSDIYSYLAVNFI